MIAQPAKSVICIKLSDACITLSFVFSHFLMSTPISKWLPQVVKCLQCEYIVSVAGVLGSEINDISVHRLLYGCKISGLEQMKFAETNIFAHWICHADETKEKEKKRSIGTPFIFLIILPIRSIFKRWCRRYSLAFSRIFFFSSKDLSIMTWQIRADFNLNSCLCRLKWNMLCCIEFLCLHLCPAYVFYCSIFLRFTSLLH